MGWEEEGVGGGSLVRYVQMPILATLVSSKVAKFGNR